MCINNCKQIELKNKKIFVLENITASKNNK